MTNYAETAKQLRASINILTPLEDDTKETSTLRRAYRIYCNTGMRSAVENVWHEIVERWGEPIDGRLPVGQKEKIGRFDLQWLEKLAKLAEFYGEHGERPRENGDREGEASLYSWKKDQRRKHSEGTLAPEHVAILDQRIPGWFEASETPDQTFMRRVNEWDSFVDKHGETPKNKGGRENEASLYAWKLYQRVKHRNGTLKPEHEAILNQRIPDLLGRAPRRSFECRVDDYARFTNRHGEPPRENGVRRDEISLYRWMWRQRDTYHKGVLSPERLATLNRRIPGWFKTAKTSGQSFEQRVNEWLNFTDRHGEWPRRSGAREGEASLYSWKKDQRRKHSEGTLPPEHEAILDQRIPGWSKAAETPDQALVRRLNEWDSFVDKHGERPRYNGDREGEASLYGWIKHQRFKHRKGTLPPEHVAILDRRIPGWSD